MATSVSYNTNEIKRTYYLNLFSANAEVKTNNSKSSEFTWQIRNLQLGTIAEIALVQFTANNANANTTFAFSFITGSLKLGYVFSISTQSKLKRSFCSGVKLKSITPAPFVLSIYLYIIFYLFCLSQS